MLRNEGTIDRVLRIVAGIVLIGLALAGPKVVWGWIGVIPLVTGIVGFCPLYRVLGIRTCATRE
jgi:membrane protein implicated in regulation of membrane protease activity